MQAQPASISALREDAGFSLSFRLREPVSSRPTACVILLHGVGGNETNLAEIAEALDPRVLVVLPRGPLLLGPAQYGWFRVTFTADGPRPDLAEADQARETLLRFISELEAAYGLSPGRTIIAGFSQGGIMSASVALSEPERVLGFGILSGRILPELAPHLASPARLKGMQAFISHGELDNVLPASWALRAEQWLSELGVAYATRRFPVGHVLSAEMQADFLRWSHALIARPTEEAAASVELSIGSEQIGLLVREGAHPPETLALEIGTENIAQTCFRHESPQPVELEEAIMVVEDALEHWRTAIPANARLFAQDAGIHEIARLAGLPAQAEVVLSREAIERTFARLVAVSQGRPASAEGLPAGRIFAARLLILREFMHHLKCEAITVRA
ncbi:hypothetical protein Q9Q94_17135 [Uliginosibacterium sp. 31-16]|uniref:alpha/beta hydrolase n=1 Tax=Uliginosibacterium sp. 31-16 TaxID=3068315 RepID=UPI00273E5726|nr:hypothetical protein [Uliginosibacterium sp. 31-16]MDP5241268.1 hypothetical protein [Uliginosibacterium sp. 31-16]